MPLVRRKLERAKSTPKFIQIEWTTWAFRERVIIKDGKV